MKITPIGHGGDFAPISIGNSNFLIEENGHFMMFDFGVTALYILRDEMKFDIGDLDAVYVSHQHQGHASLEALAFLRYFTPTKSGKPVRPKLFVSSELIKPLWCNTLKGGLDCLHGRTAGLTDYFECFPIQKSKSFIWQGLTMTPFETLHVSSGYHFVNSYGLTIFNPKTGKTVLFTSDTVFNPSGLNYLYCQASVIFQDCEVTERRSHVHANIQDLRTLPPEIKGKMLLTHYENEVDAPDFLGFAKKFQVFEF